MNKFTQILSTTNIVILIVMASGNFILGIVDYFQEFKKMGCIDDAIYRNATENDFTNCILNTGLFDINGITWIFAQFVLILASIMIASFIESRKK